MHVPMIHKELSERGCAFYAHNKDHRGRDIAIGINTFVKILKDDEHPTNAENSSMTEEEANKRKCFKPKFLAATQCILMTL